MMLTPLLTFGESSKVASSTEQKVPWQLNRLFKLVPKTDLHIHLSGSVRKQDVATFMRENGLSKEETKKELQLIRPRYDSLTDILVTYYRVPKHVNTPSQFKRAAKGIVQEVAKENVRVLTLRTSVLGKGGPPEEIIRAVEEGIREGVAWVKKHKGYEMKTGLILLAQRAGSPEDSLAHAKLAVEMSQRPDSLITGFDIAGDETKHAIGKHANAIQYIKQYGEPRGLKLTIHAGEVPFSEGISGLDSIRKAYRYGADSIGHGLQLQGDPVLKQRFVQQQIPVELCPWSNVQTGAVPDYPSHPIKPYLKDGLNVHLSTDNRLISQINLTRQLGQLWQHGLVTTWDQIKRLTLNGIRSSFIPAKEKQQAEQEALAIFNKLERRFARTIRTRLSQETATHAKRA